MEGPTTKDFERMTGSELNKYIRDAKADLVKEIAIIEKCKVKQQKNIERLQELGIDFEDRFGLEKANRLISMLKLLIPDDKRVHKEAFDYTPSRNENMMISKKTQNYYQRSSKRLILFTWLNSHVHLNRWKGFISHYNKIVIYIIFYIFLVSIFNP